MENIGIQLLIALLMGAAIGLERESSADDGTHDLAGVGVRTFALVALMGGIGGAFYTGGFPLVFAAISAGFTILLSAYYILVSQATKDFGLTTEVSFILTFLIGVAATTGIIPLQIIVAISVVIMLLLAFKNKTRALASGLSRKEIESFISYAIVALVILPFLPNQAYTINDVGFLKSLLEGFNLDVARFSTLELLNPRKMWFIVVLVTGIDVLGYILSKFIGSKKGFALTSFVGGFVSSTSTTQSLAQRSKKTSFAKYLVGAAVLANMASFFQIFLLVGPLNSRWLAYIFPTLGAIIITAGIISFFFLRQKHEKEDPTEQEEKKIFALLPALKFAVLLISVKILTGLALILFGQSGFLITSIIASFAGLDAILVNLATMAGSTISFKFALVTFIVVNATNLLSKSFYSFLQGNRSFAVKFLFAAGLIILASGIGLLAS